MLTVSKFLKFGFWMAPEWGKWFKVEAYLIISVIKFPPLRNLIAGFWLSAMADIMP